MLLLIRRNVLDLPTGFSLSYFWCGGFVISYLLVVQLVSGIILSFSYISEQGFGLAFESVIRSCLDDIFFWLIRYLHIWGVSLIFFFLFLHMGRSLYYASYLKLGVWNIGFILYLVMMLEAFLGYILPWHQMSYWAATVLSSILASVPVIGGSLYCYLIGGFAVSESTLVRVFSVHVWLAFVIVGLSVLHLFYLHLKGSNNPLCVSGGYSDVVYFHKFFSLKDGLSIVLVLFFGVVFVGFCPDFVLDVESYIQADSLNTPVSIRPEWYFLAFYAMLRCVESKLGGLVLVLIFLFSLWLPLGVSSCVWDVFRQCFFWSGLSLFVGLTFLGSCHPEYPYIGVSKLFSFSLVVVLLTYKGLLDSLCVLCGYSGVPQTLFWFYGV